MQRYQGDVRAIRIWCFVLSALLCLAGCGDEVRLPSAAEMAAFEQAGFISPVIDLERIEKAKLKTGPYRVVQGDVLEFTMPTLLQAGTAAEVQAAQTRSPLLNPCLVRVRDSGVIALPAVGSMRVAGLSLAQIEEQVTEAYKSYVVLHPSVFVRIAEYRTGKVYIGGS
jgi:protein involved in polysaccharide export with SLBB domain